MGSLGLLLHQLMGRQSENAHSGCDEAGALCCLAVRVSWTSCRIGRAKAPVLPLPVSAAAMTSPPPRMRGMLSDCTGVGSLSGTALSGISSVSEMLLYACLSRGRVECIIWLSQRATASIENPIRQGDRADSQPFHLLHASYQLGHQPKLLECRHACRWPAGHSICCISLHVADCQ